MSESEDFCRDYLRGNCSRGFKCKYKHPDAAEVAARAVSTGMDVGRTVFCRDFQKAMCNRENCKFVHATEAEELYYKMTGQMPPRLQSPNPPEVTPSSQLHQLMLNAYLTGDFTAYTHQLQVMGYAMAPIVSSAEAVGMPAMVPGYIAQPVSVPPSAVPVPGAVGMPHPGVYSPMHMPHVYQPSYGRLHTGHGSMPPVPPRQSSPRSHAYAPVMVSAAGIQAPRLSTLPPFPASPGLSFNMSPSSTPSYSSRLTSEVHRVDTGPLDSELSGPSPPPEQSAERQNGPNRVSQTMEDMQMKLEELERRVKQLEDENEMLREENATLKGQS